jgi:hypothetical protein
MKEIAHQTWMSATPTSVAASVRDSVPCRSNRPTPKSMMMCSALTNIVARPTQSHTGIRQSRPDHASCSLPTHPLSTMRGDLP